MRNFVKIVFYPLVIIRRWYIYNYLPKHNPQKYVKILYKQWFGKELDFNNPRDLNEKINWCKFYSDTSMWGKLADKYAVRGYVKEKGLEDILVKLYGVWDDVDKIDFESLPDSFILKSNNGSGTNLIVNNKADLDLEKTRKLLKGWLGTPFGYKLGEPHYLTIKPMIIAEELLDASKQHISTSSLIDYKFFCANGEPSYILVISGRSKGMMKVAVYDINWNFFPKKINPTPHHIISDDFPTPPTSLKQMINIARILGQGFPQVRVDLYEIDGKPYFGEITFTSAGGFMRYFTPEFLLELGDKVKLE